jgi:precorrin-3B synthase
LASTDSGLAWPVTGPRHDAAVAAAGPWTGQRRRPTVCCGAVHGRCQDRIPPSPAQPSGTGWGAAAGDACPGILDLHEARDGLVARIRLPGGYASRARLLSLTALAGRFGDGSVDLTARGNVQVRGIQPDAADGMAQRAAAAGLMPSPAHDRARNITASPLAGLAGRPDLRGLVRALDRAILADPGLAALPGRFLFSLDDGTGRAGIGGCDVGLRLDSGAAELVVAGRLTGLRGPAAAGVRRAAAAARAFLEQWQAETARAGSGADAGAERGSSRVAGLADGGAGVAAAAGGTLGAAVSDTTDRLALGAVPDAGQLVVIAAPLARLTAAQVRLVARLLRPGEVARLTAAGRIVLPLAGPGGAAGAALQRLDDAGLIVSDCHELATVTACAGTACAKSLADVRALAGRVPGLGAVHWAGCSRRCGLPADATAVVATPDGRLVSGDGAVLRVEARPA